MKGRALVQLVVFVVTVTMAQGAYYRRATPRRPAVFRPGVVLPRPYRLVPAASQHAPYFLYRSPTQHRYSVKQFSSPPSRVVPSSGVWRTALSVPASPATPATPAPARAEIHYLRATSAPPAHHVAGGIHTVPAPNLSLSERPIVVVEAADTPATSAERVIQDYIYQSKINELNHPSKPSYEVTEKYVEPVYQMAKIETPVGFSKMQSTPGPDEQQLSLLRNGVALQLAADYGLSAVTVPRHPAFPTHSHSLHNQPHSLQHQLQPQHFALQGFQGFAGAPPPQDLISTGANSAMIPPNVLYQSDPLFLQKLQQQLLQRFPALEFVPYAAELLPHNPQSNEAQAQQVFLLENEEIKQPEPIVSSESKNVYQREAQEGSMVTITLPQPFAVSNLTEKIEASTTQQPHNITLELIATDSQPVTTTIKYFIENTEPQTVATESANTHNTSTTPIYYAQVGQSVGNVIADGFYSAVNDVRAAEALEQVALENTSSTRAPENATTTSPISSDLNKYFVQNDIENKTVTELKPLLGVPFKKQADSVKVAYTLLRTEEKEPKRTHEGAVYAGQIVEASISEDHDFNKQKATLMKRAPIRLYVTDKETTSQTVLANSTPKMTLVKAKIPPKSKLTFDDKTGEPVLRIYASYVDSPAQRQAVTPQTSVKRTEPAASWSATAVRTGDKSAGYTGNQLTQFGVKLRARSDDYVSLFDHYDD